MEKRIIKKHWYAMVTVIAVAAWLARFCGATVGVVVLSFLLAAGGMIYFRLLGRLAWFCSGRWAWEDELQATGEDEDRDQGLGIGD